MKNLLFTLVLAVSFLMIDNVRAQNLSDNFTISYSSPSACQMSLSSNISEVLFVFDLERVYSKRSDPNTLTVRCSKGVFYKIYHIPTEVSPDKNWASLYGLNSGDKLRYQIRAIHENGDIQYYLTPTRSIEATGMGLEEKIDLYSDIYTDGVPVVDKYVADATIQLLF